MGDPEGPRELDLLLFVLLSEYSLLLNLYLYLYLIFKKKNFCTQICLRPLIFCLQAMYLGYVMRYRIHPRSRLLPRTELQIQIGLHNIRLIASFAHPRVRSRAAPSPSPSRPRSVAAAASPAKLPRPQLHRRVLHHADLAPSLVVRRRGPRTRSHAVAVAAWTRGLRTTAGL
jgi:hypothetical protein